MRYLLYLFAAICNLIALIGILYASANGNDTVQIIIGVGMAITAILVASLCVYAKDEALHKKGRRIVKEIVREIVEEDLVGKERLSWIATKPDLPAVRRVLRHQFRRK